MVPQGKLFLYCQFRCGYRFFSCGGGELQAGAAGSCYFHCELDVRDILCDLSEPLFYILRAEAFHPGISPLGNSSIFDGFNCVFHGDIKACKSFDETFGGLHQGTWITGKREIHRVNNTQFSEGRKNGSFVSQL